MTFRETYEKFVEIEEAFNLYEKDIAGFPFWDYLRYHVFNMILNRNGVFERAHRMSLQDTDRRLTRLRKIKNTIMRSAYMAPQCDYLFVGHPRRKLGADGKYWDIYCDPIIDKIGRDKCLVLEGPYRGRHFVPTHTQNVRCLDCYSIESVLNRQITQSHLSLTEEDKGMLNSLSNVISDVYDIKLDIQHLAKKHFSQSIEKKTCYVKMLRRIKPKLVFIVCSYDKEDWIAVCQELGVPTIELQHGTNGRYNVAYSYPNGAKKKLFPDYFLSFGKFWQDSTPLPLAEKRIFVLGYPYLENEIRTYKERRKQKQVLFLSQGTIGKELSRFAVNLKELLPSEYKVIYKLHPGEAADWKREYPWLFQSNVTVIEGMKPPLYELYASSVIQIGVYSTAIYEGLLFGCETYLVDLPGVEHMSYLIEKQIARKIEKPNEVQIGGEFKVKYPGEYFFAGNWEKNLTNALSEITGELETGGKEAQGSFTVQERLAPETV